MPSAPVLVSLVLLANTAAGPARAADCAAGGMPVDGPVIAEFAPIGRYAGHWGVDVATPPGTVVRAPGPGRVSFAGSVAGRLSVTVLLDGGTVVSASYLDEVHASAGDRVAAGSVLGASGRAHGMASVHVSARVDGRYVDPLVALGCRWGPLPDALRLVR